MDNQSSCMLYWSGECFGLEELNAGGNLTDNDDILNNLVVLRRRRIGAE